MVVDAYSKWLEIFPLVTATSGTTIEKLRSIFATHGSPKVLETGDGSQFITNDEFQAFVTGSDKRGHFMQTKKIEKLQFIST